VSVRDERHHPANVTLARAVGIQTKDAPIVTFAYMQHGWRQPSEDPDPIEIVTADEEFGRFDPEKYDLPLEITHL
jgi:hypothetical protein